MHAPAVRWAVMLALPFSAASALEDISLNPLWITKADDPDGERRLYQDLVLAPRWNLRFADDRLVLHPRLAVGGGYDSNPDQVVDGDGDGFATIAGGLETLWHIGVRQRLTVDADVALRRYADADADTTQGALSARFAHEGAGWNGFATADTRRQETRSGSTAQVFDRTTLRSTATVSWRGFVTRAGAALRVRREDWREDTLRFDRDERDRDVAMAMVRASRELAAGFDLGLRFEPELRRYHQSGGRYQDSVGANGLVTLQWETSPHTTLEAELGLEHRRYDADFANDPAYDDRTVTAPIGIVRWVWRFAADDAFDVGSRISADDGDDANHLQTWVIYAAGQLRMSAASNLRLLLEWQRFRPSGPSTDNDWQGGLRYAELRYRTAVGHGLGFAAHASYVDSVDGYDRWIGRLEAIATF